MIDMAATELAPTTWPDLVEELDRDLRAVHAADREQRDHERREQERRPGRWRARPAASAPTSAAATASSSISASAQRAVIVHDLPSSIPARERRRAVGSRSGGVSPGGRRARRRPQWTHGWPTGPSPIRRALARPVWTGRSRQAITLPALYRGGPALCLAGARATGDRPRLPRTPAETPHPEAHGEQHAARSHDQAEVESGERQLAADASSRTRHRRGGSCGGGRAAYRSKSAPGCFPDGLRVALGRGLGERRWPPSSMLALTIAPTISFLNPHEVVSLPLCLASLP